MNREAFWYFFLCLDATQPSELVTIIVSFVAVYFPVTDKTICTLVGLWNNEKFTENQRRKFGSIQDWDVSQVTNMTGMFRFQSTFNDDISRWDVSKVTCMNQMFIGAFSFNQPLANWNVSQVITMCGMFEKTQKFNQPLDTWNVSNVRDMSWMFAEAQAFNQSLECWNVNKNTTYLVNMF